MYYIFIKDFSYRVGNIKQGHIFPESELRHYKAYGIAEEFYKRYENNPMNLTIKVGRLRKRNYADYHSSMLECEDENGNRYKIAPTAILDLQNKCEFINEKWEGNFIYQSYSGKMAIKPI